MKPLVNSNILPFWMLFIGACILATGCGQFRPPLDFPTVDIDEFEDIDLFSCRTIETVSAVSNEQPKRIESCRYLSWSMRDTIGAYQSYLKNYPNGMYRHAAEETIRKKHAAAAHAAKAQTAVDFDKAMRIHKVTAYQQFLKKHPDTAYTRIIKRQIRDLTYQSALKQGTLEAYSAYLDTYPDSPACREINRRLKTLHLRNTCRQGTLDAFENFRTRFPTSAHVSQVNTWILKRILTDKTIAKEYIQRFPDTACANIASITLKKWAFSPTEITIGDSNPGPAYHGTHYPKSGLFFKALGQLENGWSIRSVVDDPLGHTIRNLTAYRSPNTGPLKIGSKTTGRNILEFIRIENDTVLLGFATGCKWLDKQLHLQLVALMTDASLNGEQPCPPKTILARSRTEPTDFPDSNEPQKRKPLSKDDIRQIVSRHIGEVTACYERGLIRNPKIEGRITMKFTIADTGKVHNAAITDSTLQAPPVENCITRAMLRWDFPKRGEDETNTVVVTYPFLFMSPE